MADDALDKPKRDRSPSFPFIPLKKAVDRALEFASAYKRNPARVTNVASVWRLAPKSSTALQTVAALKAFGLVNEEGSGENRRVSLSDLAWRIVRAQQSEIREKALGEAALSPKLLAAYWEKWRDDRPPDAECVDDLTFDNGFNDAAARRFLEVYDETIAFAKLAESDSLPEVGGDTEDDRPAPGIGRHAGHENRKPPESEVTLMEGERVVFTQEITPQRHLRLVVSGPVDDELIETLELYVDLMRKRLGRTTRAAVRLPLEADDATQTEEEPEFAS